MGLAYEIRKREAERTRAIRRLQRRRNLIAEGKLDPDEDKPKPSGVKIQKDPVPENKMLDAPGENKAEPVEEFTLDDVPFASPRAREVADENNLTVGDFTGQTPSGTGGFTAADVRAIAGQA